MAGTQLARDTMHARRALLYVPGDDMHKISKAAALHVDTVCMDMEDGVAVNCKEDARRTIAEALRRLDFGSSERLTRINAIGSGMEEEDLATVLPAQPDGIVVPKVSQAAQVRWVSQQLARYERTAGLAENSIRLLAIVESAAGIVRLAEIAGADPRLEGLIFGSEDLASDMGATRTLQGWEVFYARSAIVTHAAAYHLQAIDMVQIDFHDQEGLRREAEQGAQMGFSGKQVIHPNQIAIVQQAFTPSDEAIDHALRLVEAFIVYQASGQGAFAIDGKMIDAPIIKAAENVLTRARAAGKIT